MIIPAILEQNFIELKRKIELMDGVCDSIQIDFVDNKLVEGITFLETEKLSEIEHKTPLELHFMVENPLDYLALDKGKIPGVIKVCTQLIDNTEEVLKKLKLTGYITGLSINPEEEIELVKPFMEYLDFVQFMGVIPGRQGNPFIPQVLDKIKEFKKRYPNIKTQIDGGVNETTLPLVIQSGVDNIGIGSAIFNSEDPRKKFLEFKTAHGRTNYSK